MVWKESFSKSLSQIRRFTNQQMFKQKKLTKPSDIFSSVKRFVSRRTFSPMELATGLEKRLLLMMKAGNEDPYDMIMQKRGPGTLQCPNLVPSVGDKRLVGCLCHPDDIAFMYMWLHKGTPKRCYCGYWFKLVEKSPV